MIVFAFNGMDFFAGCGLIVFFLRTRDGAGAVVAFRTIRCASVMIFIRYLLVERFLITGRLVLLSPVLSLLRR